MRALFFSALLLWVVLFNLRPLSDPDVFWHLASGALIWSRRAIPRVDVFSWTCAGRPWIDSYWLYDTLLSALHKLVGLNGVIVASALFAALILAVPQLWLRARGVAWPWRAAALIAAALGAFPGGAWGARASLVTVFFVSLLWVSLERLEERGAREPWGWVLLFALWANLHRGFVLGLALAGAYALGDALERRAGPRRWLWLAACAAATALNPYGLGLFRMIRDDHALSPAHVYGWARTPWRGYELFWLSALALLAMVAAEARRGKRPRAGRLLAAAFLGWEGFQSLVGATYFVVLAAPMLAETASRLWPRLAKLAARREKPLLAAGLAAACLAMAVAPVAGGADAALPVKACDFIAARGVQGPFFNDYRFGGYWMWRFGAARGDFIDGRYPAVDGYAPLLSEIEAAKHGRPEDWEAFLDRHGAQAALVNYPQGSPLPSLFEAYFPRRRWALVYWDDAALIFVRRGGANDGIIKDCEQRIFSPDGDARYFAQRWATLDAARRETLLADLKRNPSRRAKWFLSLAAP